MSPLLASLQAYSVQPVKCGTPLCQVFDSGLIGEGVLHMLQHGWQHLLQPDAILVEPSPACLLAIQASNPGLEVVRAGARGSRGVVHALAVGRRFGQEL